MNEHRTAAAPYDWTSDHDFTRVLTQTGEHTPGHDTLPTTTSAVFTSADLARVPTLDDLTRVAHLPVYYDTPRAGTMEVRTADGRTLWVYFDADSDPSHTAGPRDQQPSPTVVSRWAVDTAVVSLSVSGATWITSLALGEFAHAAVAVAAALASLGKLALVAAVMFGLIAIIKKKTTTVIEQTINAHVTANGFLGRARIDRASIDTQNGH